MRNKTFCLLFLSLLLWAVVTYLIVFQGNGPNSNSNSAEEQSKLSRQLDSLQKELDSLLEANGRLLAELTARESRRRPPSSNEAQPNLQGSSNNNNRSTSSSSSSSQLYEIPKVLPNGAPVIPVLVISCNRVSIKRCLDQLIGYRPSREQFPIIVSQDCEHRPTHGVIESYRGEVHSIRQPDQSDIEGIPPKERKFKGYFKIARHYGWALNQTFLEYGFESAIVVEDDLDVSVDFFDYFLGTHPVLVGDPSLWCVSAWNDNGKASLVDPSGPHLLYRSDFFPGLGWMLTRELWRELGPKWPRAYWDDWIRQPEQRRDRACIRPELSRTRTFGKVGVSNGMFYEKHLKYIHLNEQRVPFAEMNLTYLAKASYDPAFEAEVYSRSRLVGYEELRKKLGGRSRDDDGYDSYRIAYHTRQSYKATAKMLGLMDDFKSGVPRTGYRGVVTFFYAGKRVHLAPGTSWTGYDPTWS